MVLTRTAFLLAVAIGAANVYACERAGDCAAASNLEAHCENSECVYKPFKVARLRVKPALISKQGALNINVCDDCNVTVKRGAEICRLDSICDELESNSAAQALTATDNAKAIADTKAFSEEKIEELNVTSHAARSALRDTPLSQLDTCSGSTQSLDVRD